MSNSRASTSKRRSEHGRSGAGDAELAAPAIGGIRNGQKMPEVYPENLLRKVDTMPDYQVRDGRPGDFDAMRDAIAAAIHPALVIPGFDEVFHAETEQIVASVEAAFRQGLTRPRQGVLVGVLDDRPCGFLIFDASQGAPEIRWIVALPEHIGTGLAKGLMQFLIEHRGGAADITLIVTHYNDRAIRFFRGFGFVEAPAGASGRRVLRMRRSAPLAGGS